ncbi:MAG: hypothetical protein KDC44_16725, partial [Phaeodactylibacter sp.]|nr:hypothetical protein [Phaeodactylibacter sp.]
STAITISFKSLAGKSITNGEVSTSYKVASRPMKGTSKKLMVQRYPAGSQDLTDDILFPSITANTNQQLLEADVVYISPTDANPPVNNRIHLNLKHNQGNLVENWDSDTSPFFNISFSYGSSDDDLTDVLQQGNPGYNPLTSAINIQPSIHQTDMWTMEPPDGTGVWKFVPTAQNLNLFSEGNQNLDLFFDHVITLLPEGNATIFIQWGNIPGFNGGWKTRNIIKQSAPAGVLNFTGIGGTKSEVLQYGQFVRLNWTAFAAPQVKLTIESVGPPVQHIFPVPGKQGSPPQLFYCGGISPEVPDPTNPCANLSLLKIQPDSQTLTCLLQALDANGNPIGDQTEPVKVSVQYPPPKIDSISVTLQENILHFNWIIEGPG